VYPIVYLDALFVKMRHEGRVGNRAVYVVIGVGLEGQKEVLGLWIADTEGAKFWLGILTELRNRGVQDIFIACVDGLKGFPDAIETVFPQTRVQLCIVHLIRNSLKFVNWKDRKHVVPDLRAIYSAPTAEAARQELIRFGEKWDKLYSPIRPMWERNWEHIIPFLAFPLEIRKIIYSTNAVESLNMSLRKIIKMRGSFPNEEAALKLLYLALRNVAAKWQRTMNWTTALNQFAVLWGDRIRPAASSK
jgi:putative transposase